MTNVIYDINEDFDFKNLSLNPPTVVAGGNYFIKYSMNGSPLYIQPPECKTRGNISKSSKKVYCDLMFSQDNSKLIQWMEDLETQTCKMIYDKREDWFDSEMDLADIENYFASPIKSYKSGKFYLTRASIPNRLGKVSLKIYNENKEEVSIDTIIDNTSVMSILEIQGVKCSARSFQIEMEIKQLMTIKQVNLFNDCLINNNKTNIIHQSHDVLETVSITDDKKEAEYLEETSMEEPEEAIVEKALDETPKIENDDIFVATETNDLDDLEFNVDLEILDKSDAFTIKPHNDIYYERYREAQKRARIAKNLALQAYLEAKEIKNKYHLDDIDSDDDDFFNTDDAEFQGSVA
jgi:hypothetical protein